MSHPPSQWRGVQGATSGPAFIVLLGFLTMVGPLSTDMSLPAFPAMAAALRTANGMVQWTLSTFLLGFAVGQLVIGPLSDRYGRRPVLLSALGIFSLTGLVCALANDIRVLIALRFVQGATACAGLLCVRAIIRDVESDANRAAAMQGYVSALQAFSIMAAPLLGAGALLVVGWRGIFGFLGLCGALLLLAVLVRLPETSPRVSRGTWDAYARVMRLPRTAGLAGFIAFMVGSYFALLTVSPFVLMERFHVPTALFVVACALLLGAFATARLVRRVGAERMAHVGVALVFASCSGCWVADWLKPSAWGFALTMGFFAFTLGVAMPTAYATALADCGKDAGVASGILGAVQMIGAAAFSAVVAVLPWKPSLAAGMVVCFGGFAAVGSYSWSWRKARDHRIAAITSIPIVAAPEIGAPECIAETE